jgi:hypothetical protein
MAKRDVAEFVCRPFCSFYREGAREELICNGARLLEMLVKTGVLSPGAPADVEEGSYLSPREHVRLEEIVCRPCPFLPDGCDFRSEAPPLDAEPCGGYFLLALLAGNGVVSVERLKEIEVEQKRMA